MTVVVESAAILSIAAYCPRNSFGDSNRESNTLEPFT